MRQTARIIIVCLSLGALSATIFLSGCGVGEYNERVRERGNDLFYGES